MKQLVNLIKSWDILEQYAGGKMGFYQLIKNDCVIEVRVQTGRIGFIREFKENDPLYCKIVDFCRKRQYIEVSEHLRDEEFFK